MFTQQHFIKLAETLRFSNVDKKTKEFTTLYKEIVYMCQIANPRFKEHLFKKAVYNN